VLFNRKKTGKGHFVRANKAVFKELWCNPDGIQPHIFWEYPKVCVNLQTDVR